MIRIRKAALAVALAVTATLSLGAAPASAHGPTVAQTSCSAWAPVDKTGVVTRSCLSVTPGTQTVPPIVRNLYEVRNTTGAYRDVEVKMKLVVNDGTTSTVYGNVRILVKPGATYRKAISEYNSADHGNSSLRNVMTVHGHYVSSTTTRWIKY